MCVTVTAITVQRIKAEDTVDLRHRVMWPNLPKQDVILPEDAFGLHYGAFLDHKLVGVGSVFIAGPKARLRKLAVEDRLQGRGIASHLLGCAFRALSAEGCTSVWCDARVSASDFYLRNGFSLSGQVFQKRGIDYVIASRDL